MVVVAVVVIFVVVDDDVVVGVSFVEETGQSTGRHVTIPPSVHVQL